MKKYQLKIMIKNAKPPVWRRCVVPSGISFAKLGELFNIIMGWSGEKKQEFEFYYKKLILSDDEREGRKGECKKASEQIIDSYMEQEEWFTYTYDLENPCQHRVNIEEVLEEENDIAYVVKYKGDCFQAAGEEIVAYDVEAVNRSLKEAMISEEQIEEQLQNVMGQLFAQIEEQEKNTEDTKEEQKTNVQNTNYYNDFIYRNRMNLMVQRRNEKTASPCKIEKKVYPNDPCICGSGKKYKHCCKGKVVGQ